ncbi:hypothetical protein [Neorhizobium sp. T25_13]|uniref:hypothetical protein n=1 Tax=Neorhizobium sp. T25_13 TaxID=2093830 RepID=UPI000CF93B67|nr:hypothetical protein [Neorhizobium sp. T25_13]
MTVYNLPSARLLECTFSLDDGTVSSAFKRGVSFNITQVFDPTFRARIQTMPLDQAGMQAWTAWKARLRGGLNRFAAYDTSRAAPLHYLGARTPDEVAPGWAGAGSLASVGVGGAISVTGAPAGYVATEGDRLALEQSGYVALYEIVSNATASGAGAIDLSVYPFIQSYFTAGAVARLWRPKGLFRIDWTSWQMAVVASPSSISFEGYQVLK